MNAEPIKPCRSALYMPASNPRALAKGPSLNADVIIINLEDAVAPNNKKSARAAAIDALTTLNYGRRQTALRINGIGTPWHVDDLEAAFEARPDIVVVPKVESMETLAAVQARLAEGAGRSSGVRIESNASSGMRTHGEDLSDVLAYPESQRTSSKPIRLWAMMETPRAVIEAASIAAFGPPLEALLVGHNDLARAAGMPLKTARQMLHPWLMTFLAAAKANELQIIDSVFNDFRDLDGLASECVEGLAIGMNGKSLIHPAQLHTVNTHWTPDADAIADANAIVEAFATSDAGVINMNGRMVERLHLDMANRTLALAAMLNK